jgi:ABC-type oligopeptide transport system substrate-binding subunit
MFQKINKITFTVILDNASLQEAYEKGMVDIRIKDTDQLKIRIGIAADADAIMNFTKENK